MSICTVFETFEKVAATSGRNAKIELLNQLAAVDILNFREVVEFTKNPFWTYRVSAPDVSSRTPEFADLNHGQAEILWSSFKSILVALRTRKCTLQEGRDGLADVMGSAPALYRKYLAQIVNRDLKIGVDSWDRWFPGMLPKEPVMLCEKYDGEDLTGDWTAEPKLDGYRAAVEVVDYECNAISRGNKEFWNWEHIALQVGALGILNCTLDGEFYAGNFGLTSSICKTQGRHPQAHLLKYHIFDQLTPQEWSSRKCSRTTAQRKQALYEFFWMMGFRPVEGSVDLVSEEYPNIVYVVGVPVKSPEDFMEAAETFYHKGFEGTVLKEMSSVYEWDRSTKWLKIKPEEDADLVVVGALLGEEDGKHSDRLGRFLVSGTVTYKKKQYVIENCRVGGGLKDHERDKYWKLHQEGKLIGLVIEVLYQDVTTEVCAGTKVPSLRFPRFRRERLDKTPMDWGGRSGL